VIEIEEFDFDEDNSAHCAAHGIYPEDLYDALDTGEWVAVPNKRGMAGSHLFIGRDRSGRIITAPIGETSEPGVWRPFSAWPAKPSEARHLR
jgi:hypothetical protein